MSAVEKLANLIGHHAHNISGDAAVGQAAHDAAMHVLHNDPAVIAEMYKETLNPYEVRCVRHKVACEDMMRASSESKHDPVPQLRALLPKVGGEQEGGSQEDVSAALSESPATPDYRKLYNELLFVVANKIPGESRHETARRIIWEHEHRESCGPAQSELPKEESDE